jgi:chemosensory pili system protein ChpA (sensor histidine kinase/response regulator)
MTDKDLACTHAEECQQTNEGSEEGNLQWLLEMDLDEPEEKLFAVDMDEYVDSGLSASESEVASRPMFRGKDGADDLATYVAEEIVISSETESSDIYSASRESADAEASSAPSVDEPMMALDFSARVSHGPATTQGAVTDGSDILGLLEESAPAIADEPESAIAAEAAVEEQAVVAASDSSPVTAEASVALVEAPAEGLADQDGRAEPGVEVDTLAVMAEDFDAQAFAPLEGDAAFDPTAEADVDFPDAFGAMPGTEQAFDPALAEATEAVGMELDVAGEGLGEMDLLDAEPAGMDLPDAEPVGAHSVGDELQETSSNSSNEESPLGELADTDPEALKIFDDDLFSEDPSDQAMTLGATEPTDIDAFFDDLDESSSPAERAPTELEELASVGKEPEVLEAVAERIEDIAAGGEEAVEVEAVATETAVQADSTEGETAPEQAPADQDIAAVAASAETAGDLSWAIPEDITFNYTSRSGTEIFVDFLDAFIEEGSVELEKLEDAVSAWEEDIDCEAAFTTVTRILHTIKGIAKGVGLQFYGTLIHNFETLLEALPRPAADATQDYFRIVNVWLDAAVRGLEHVRENGQDIASEFPHLPGQDAPVESEADPAGARSAGDNGRENAQPKSPAEGAPTENQAEQRLEASEEEVAESAREAAAPLSERKQRERKLADEGARALAAQQTVRITPERLDHLLNLANQAQQLGVRTAQGSAAGKRAASELQARLQSVRSHIGDISDRALFNIPGSAREPGSGKMDALEMDQYSEIQEAASILREGIEDIADLVELAIRHNGQVEALLKQQSSVISSLGSSVRAARVVPVSRLMPGLRRLVRTVSTDLGKNVALGVVNEVGTLDRDDYARCQIVLEHMVRNALDHGIESPQDRLDAGKPVKGLISVDVRRAGANSLITLADDGRGIDPQAMRENARRKGLDVDVDALSDEEALRLIFHKGFSTASSVSEISGRGVGMDIVLSELQQMGGDVRIESTLGGGTAFHITIPTNITVNGALLVKAGASSYAIPLGGLLAVEHVPVTEFFAAVEAGDMLELSGIECEPTYLATLCERDAQPEKKTWTGSVPVIVAGGAGRYMAIAIDHVEEALELVIRSLGPQFAAVPGVAGAATTADGEALVALDLNLLVESAPDREEAGLCVPQDSDEPLRILVVDDSRTQRMVTTNQLETLVGVETMTAENGAVAIDLLNSADRLPDVVLLDVEMPVKDGIETLREIRKSVRYSHLPVIMITSRTGLKHRTLAEQAGCNGYMGKPFNFPLLVGQINELTGHRLQLN